jgi:hypothetical protein
MTISSARLTSASIPNALLVKPGTARIPGTAHSIGVMNLRTYASMIQTHARAQRLQTARMAIPAQMTFARTALAIHSQIQAHAMTIISALEATSAKPENV